VTATVQESTITGTCILQPTGAYLVRSSEVSSEKFRVPNDLDLEPARTAFSHFRHFSDQTSS